VFEEAEGDRGGCAPRLRVREEVSGQGRQALPVRLVTPFLPSGNRTSQPDAHRAQSDSRAHSQPRPNWESVKRDGRCPVTPADPSRNHRDSFPGMYACGIPVLIATCPIV